VLGSIGAIACLGLWAITGQTSDLLLVISFTAILFNLFNLLPVGVMDGGRITQAVGGGFNWIGLLGLYGLILYARSPNLMLIGVLVLDGITMPLWLKPTLGWLLWLAMTTLFLAGYGVGWIIDSIDVALGAYLAGLFTWADTRRRRYGLEQPTDTRPLPPGWVRLGWLAAYVVLVVLLCSTVVLQTAWQPRGSY